MKSSYELAMERFNKGNPKKNSYWVQRLSEIDLKISKTKTNREMEMITINPETRDAKMVSKKPPLQKAPSE